MRGLLSYKRYKILTLAVNQNAGIATLLGSSAQMPGTADEPTRHHSPVRGYAFNIQQLPRWIQRQCTTPLDRPGKPAQPSASDIH